MQIFVCTCMAMQYVHKTLSAVSVWKPYLPTNTTIVDEWAHRKGIVAQQIQETSDAVQMLEWKTENAFFLS